MVLPAQIGQRRTARCSAVQLAHSGVTWDHQPPSETPAMSNQPSIRMGHVIHSAVAIGDGAKAIAAGQGAVETGPIGDLSAIRDILATVPGMEPKALTRLDETRAELEKATPDKGEAADLIGQALTYARTADGVLQLYDRLAPRIESLTHWLGASASDLLSLLG